jgi:hypothetical protein
MKLIVFLLFSISLSVFAQPSKDCATIHLHDAIKLNKKRKPLYAELTDGKSKKISNKLINLEWISIALMTPLDKLSRKYQKKGIPILCEDFIDMELTPEFSSEPKVPGYTYSSVPKVNVKSIKKKLKASLKVGLNEFIHDLETELHKLESYPHYNCLTRHLFESLIRSAHLVRPYREAAKREGLKDPKRLLYKNLKLQMFSLGFFYTLDRKAAGVQEEGVPILCQDVPPIEISTRSF